MRVTPCSRCVERTLNLLLVPLSATIRATQENRFKDYHNQLKHALQEYERTVRSIVPVMTNLLQPRVQVSDVLRPWYGRSRGSFHACATEPDVPLGFRAS